MKFVKKHVFFVFRNIAESSSLSQFQLTGVIFEQCTLPAIFFLDCVNPCRLGMLFLHGHNVLHHDLSYMSLCFASFFPVSWDGHFILIFILFIFTLS